MCYVAMDNFLGGGQTVSKHLRAPTPPTHCPSSLLPVPPHCPTLPFPLCQKAPLPRPSAVPRSLQVRLQLVMSFPDSASLQPWSHSRMWSSIPIRDNISDGRPEGASASAPISLGLIMMTRK